jgi:hypothetical protein
MKGNSYKCGDIFHSKIHGSDVVVDNVIPQRTCLILKLINIPRLVMRVWQSIRQQELHYLCEMSLFQGLSKNEVEAL